jgi:hypothetical protein
MTYDYKKKKIEKKVDKNSKTVLALSYNSKEL